MTIPASAPRLVPLPWATPSPAFVPTMVLKNDLPATKGRAGRWVFELGGFGGGFWGNMSVVSPSREARDQVLLVRKTGNEMTSTCAHVPCSYTASSQREVIFGLSGFVGYAERTNLHLGGRILAGGSFNGTGILALGPAAAARIWGPIWLGGWLLIGIAAGTADASVTAAPPSRPLPR